MTRNLLIVTLLAMPMCSRATCEAIAQSIDRSAAQASATEGTPAPSTGNESPGKNLTIYFVDRTDSSLAGANGKDKEKKGSNVAQPPMEPDTMRAVIELKTRVDEISAQPSRMAAVILHNDQAVLVADKDGKPFSSTLKFRQALQDKWGEKPSGGTRLIDGYEAIWKLVEEHAGDGHVTILATGDAIPGNGLLRPNDFPEVQAELDDFISRGIRSLEGEDPQIIQAQLNQLNQVVKDRNSEIFKRLTAIQARAEFMACIGAANALATRNLRWITLAFNDLDELRKLHAEAGGTEKDFQTILPASQFIQVGIAIGLFNGDRIDIPVPMQFPDPAPGEGERVFSFTQELTVPAIAKRALIVPVFDRSIKEFGKQAELVLEWSSGRIVAGATSDPEATLLLDAVGNTAGVAFSVEQFPNDGKFKLSFRSATETLEVPVGHVHTFLSRRDDLISVFHPETAGETASPPYQIHPEDSLNYFGFIGNTAAATRLEIDAMEAVFIDEAGGETIHPMAPDPDYVSSFVSGEPIRLPAGKYLVKLYYEFQGIVIDSELPDLIHCVGEEEHLDLDLSKAEGNRASHWIEFPPMGDRQVEHDITVGVFGWKKEPVTVEPRIVTDGQQIFPPELFALPKQIVVRSDRPAMLRIGASVPPFSDSLKDGVMEGRLVFFLVGRNRIIDDVRLRGQEPGEVGETPPNTVRLEFKRPIIILKISFDGENVTANSDAKNVEAKLEFRSGVATDKNVMITARHNSELEQTITLMPLSEMKIDGKKGVSMRFRVEFEPGTAFEQLVPPGGQAIWKLKVYDLEPTDVHRPWPEKKASMEFGASGIGVRQSTFELSVAASRSPLIMPMMLGVAVLGGLLALLAIWMFLRSTRFARFLENRRVVLKPNRPFASIGVSPHRGPSPILTFLGQIGMKRSGEKQFKSAGTRYQLRPEDRLARNRIKLAERKGNPIETEVLDWQVSDQGVPSVEMVVRRSGPFLTLFSRTRRTSFRLFLVAIPLALIVWVWVEHPKWIAPAIEWALTYLATASS